jgi:predicted NBD/HSP70 family sugar kinase
MSGVDEETGDVPGPAFPVLRPAQVRTTNAAAVLRVLVASGPQPRSELASRLGLTHGPVTRIVAQLVRAGLVRETAPLDAGRPGRPRVPVALVPHARHAVGVHVGARMLSAGLVDLASGAGPTLFVPHDGTPDGVADLVARTHRDLVAGTSSPSLGLGLITAGWVDPVGVVREQPLLQWRDVPLRALVEDRTAVRTTLESTPRALATADLLYGLSPQDVDTLHVYVGNALEVALVLGGRVQRTDDGYGGDFSDTVVALPAGGSARARDLVSDQAIQRAAARRGLPEVERLEELVPCAADPRYTDAWAATTAEAAEHLGLVLAHVSSLLGPRVIVVSSPLRLFDDHLPVIERTVRQGIRGGHLPRVRTSTLPGAPLPLAAAAGAVDASLATPFDVAPQPVRG